MRNKERNRFQNQNMAKQTLAEKLRIMRLNRIRDRQVRAYLRQLQAQQEIQRQQAVDESLYNSTLTSVWRKALTPIDPKRIQAGLR